MKHKIVHFPEKQRFELQNAGNEPAYVSYRLNGKKAVLDHTFVPDSLRGQGIAAIIVEAALDAAREAGWKVVPECSYIEVYIRRHPQYADLL